MTDARELTARNARFAAERLVSGTIYDVLTGLAETMVPAQRI